MCYNFFLDFAPEIQGLELTPLMGGASPAISLTWNNAFDAVPPVGYNITYSGEKLTGVIESPSDTSMLLLEDVQTSDSAVDYAYNVTDLLFYTEYSFSVAAIYNLTGTEVESSPVNVSHTTEEGGIDIITANMQQICFAFQNL